MKDNYILSYLLVFIVVAMLILTSLAFSCQMKLQNHINEDSIKIKKLERKIDSIVVIQDFKRNIL